MGDPSALNGLGYSYWKMGKLVLARLLRRGKFSSRSERQQWIIAISVLTLLAADFLCLEFGLMS